MKAKGEDLKVGPRTCTGIGLRLVKLISEEALGDVGSFYIR